MRKFITAATCFLMLIHAQAQLGNITLSGEITKPNSDSIRILDLTGAVQEVIKLKEDNTFSSQFSIPKGRYRLNDSKEGTNIYLDEGYDLALTLNTDSFDESIHYSGEGSTINNYLAENALMKEQWGFLNYYGYYCKLEESAFLKLSDSLHQASIQMLSSYTIQDNQFIAQEIAGFDHELMYKHYIYGGTHKILTKKPDFKVSDSFPDPFATLDINNPELIEAPGYLSRITDYLSSLKRGSENPFTDDYPLFVIQTAIDSISDRQVREQVLYRYCLYRLTDSKEMDKCFELFKANVRDTEHIKTIEQKYLARKKTENGKPSPPFAFEDINGKVVKHSDLFGKLTYIDIWATWCGPCLREIPYFDTLQEALADKEIQFVSICQNDKKESWEKMVADKNLKGIQLYTEDNSASFFKDYEVNGIPRYILLDENGIIIDSDALRPSNKKLLEQLNTLLADED